MSGASQRGAPSDPAVIGRVVRPQGLRGEVVVAPQGRAGAEPPETLWVDSAWRRVTGVRADNKGRWVIGLQGIADRDAAEALRGAEVAVDADDLPPLQPDSYYVHDLVGCRVEDATGNDIGQVAGVVSGPQDLLEVERDGERSLIPMARDLLLEIDIEERRIVIDAPQGLAEATRS